MRKQFYIPFTKQVYDVVFKCEGYDVFIGGHHDFTAIASVESLNWKDLVEKQNHLSEMLGFIPGNIEITDYYLYSIRNKHGEKLWETTRPDKKPTHRALRIFKEYLSIFYSPFLLLAVGAAYICNRFNKK